MKTKALRSICCYFVIGVTVVSILMPMACSSKTNPFTASAVSTTITTISSTSTLSIQHTISITTTSSTVPTSPITPTTSTTPSDGTWSLNLVGVVTRVVDQSLFAEGTGPGCHGAIWKDAQGQVWSGIPLWLLAGYVDDKNNAMEIDSALWLQGFKVQVVSASGTTEEFTSAEIDNNNNLIVAYQVNGQPLPTTQWPLVLVGSDVDQQHEISQISEIKLILPSPTATTSTTGQ